MHILYSELLTDLHYLDLNLYGAASVTLTPQDQGLCNDDICGSEVANNQQRVCNGTNQKYCHFKERWIEH